MTKKRRVLTDDFIVLVCGGRGFKSRDLVWKTLDALEPTPDRLVHGGATGADSLADQWARERCIPVARYSANWAVEGRAAGPRRNERMLREERPSLVIAFPGSIGTADMVERARAHRIKVQVVVEEQEQAR